MIQSNARRWSNVPLRRDHRFDTYFHTLSHDLRTPLTQISGFAELLILDENLALDQREYAAAIVSACGELNHAVLAHLRLIESSLGSEDGPDQPGEEVSGDPSRSNGVGPAMEGRRSRGKTPSASTARSRDDPPRE